MDRAEHLARVRAALNTSERLLGAHAGRGVDLATRVEVTTYLGEVRRLLAQLEEGEESSERAEGAPGARQPGAGVALLDA